ncbi:MAG: hypothetical protein AB7W59_31795 [Acidimicrobiia bacterium]
MIKDRNRARRTTLTLLSSAVAAGTLVALAPAAGAAAPGAGGGWTVDTCAAAGEIVDLTWKLIRATDDPRKIAVYVKIANTVADGYFANCVEAP